MNLDYNSTTGDYFIRLPRTDAATVDDLMRNHGLDYSTTASVGHEVVLFTKEPFCALTFLDGATPRALLKLEPLANELRASMAPEDQGHYKVPADRQLWSFQKADLAYMLRRTNSLDGDEPGLGKTPTAICYANEIGAKRVIVVCPASIRLQWVKRIREWSTMPWPLIIHPILTSRNGVHPNARWTVLSYELASQPSIKAALMRATYDLLIMDEAHYLKTSATRRAKAVFDFPDGLNGLASRCGSLLALTGTPLPNRPREAYTLARGLNFDAIDWMSEHAFGERFNPRVKRDIETEYGTRTFVDERSGRHAELQNRLRVGFMTRHLKRDVMPQLKMPVYDLIQVEDSGPVKQALHAESMLAIDPENLSGADAQVMGDISTVRRMMGIALAPQVCDHVEMLLAGGEEKLVLFGWHTQVLDIYQHRLGKYGLVRVDGSSSARSKGMAVDLFNIDPGTRIIIGNLLSLGTGTDGLQNVCNHALIGEPSWTPGENIQAFDRLDRGGQQRTVQGDIFVAPGSFAEKVLASSLRKLQTTHRALDKRGYSL